MLFGFRFLRQVLFGENSIAVKQEAAEKRKQRVREHANGSSARPGKALEAQQDGMYEDSVG